MNLGIATLRLEVGLSNEDDDCFREVLGNLIDGTCDAAELIPLLEQIAEKNYFYHYDDNGAGGMPRPTGPPSSWRNEANRAIESIRENLRFESRSPIVASLKDFDQERVASAVEEVTRGEHKDPTLIPILEKIASKGKDSFLAKERRLAEAARSAIQRIRSNIEAHGGSPGDSGVAACSACGAIPGTATVNAGPDEFFGVAIASLKQHGLGRESDLRECLKCGDFFHWRKSRAAKDSGDDTGTLSRFPSAQAAVLRALVKRDAGAAVDPAALAARLLELPDELRALAAHHLRERDRELARRLFPALVGVAAQGNPWCEQFLMSLTRTPEDATLVLDLLAAEPDSLEELHALARSVCCAICGPIVAQSPRRMARAALQKALASLRQLIATDYNELWECRACDSLFRWASGDGRNGELAWVELRTTDAWRACAQGGAGDERAIEVVVACGEGWRDLLYEYAWRHDFDSRIAPFLRAVVRAGAKKQI